MKTYFKVKPHVAQCYEVGAILENNWGYEQTNIDFYCIIERTANFVTLLPMKQHTSPEVGFMTNYETPTEIDWSAKPFKRKLAKNKSDGKEAGCGIASYGWCRLWDGKPSLSTHYA